MSGVALAVGVGDALYSGYSSNRASKRMADASREASAEQIAEEQNALAAYRDALAKATPLFTPYLSAGTEATGVLQQLMRPGGYLYNAPDMTDFRSDPEYKNILNQALDAIRSSRAGKGGLYSGQTDADLMRQAADLADRSYQTIYGRKLGEQNTLASRLGSLSDTGSWAAGSLADLYTGNARDVGQTLENIGKASATGTLGVGEADASGIIGTADALTQGIGFGLNTYNARKNQANYQKIMDQYLSDQDAYKSLMDSLSRQNMSSYTPYTSTSGYGYATENTLPTLDSYMK